MARVTVPMATLRTNANPERTPTRRTFQILSPGGSRIDDPTIRLSDLAANGISQPAHPLHVLSLLTPAFHAEFAQLRFQGGRREAKSRGCAARTRDPATASCQHRTDVRLLHRHQRFVL